MNKAPIIVPAYQELQSTAGLSNSSRGGPTGVQGGIRAPAQLQIFRLIKKNYMGMAPASLEWKKKNLNISICMG